MSRNHLINFFNDSLNSKAKLYLHIYIYIYIYIIFAPSHRDFQLLLDCKLPYFSTGQRNMRMFPMINSQINIITTLSTK